MCSSQIKCHQWAWLRWRCRRYASSFLILIVLCNCFLIEIIPFSLFAAAFGVKVYKPTRECSMAGGICVLESNCAQDQLTQRRGLCSEPNVECCYEGNLNIYFVQCWFWILKIIMTKKIRFETVAPKQGPCREFGGLCSAANECTKDLHQPLANDCGSKVCCILVN